MGRVPRSCIPGWPRLYRTLRSIRLKEVPLTEPRAPRPERSRGYAPFAVSEEQDEALAAIRAAAGRPGAVGIFDLDGCLFDTRPRILHLLRELAGQRGLPDLYCVRPEHFLDWDLGRTLRLAGLPEARVTELLPFAKTQFAQCFFRSDYVIHDHAMPGGPALVWDCYRAGMHIVYLTGRHEEMREGTEVALRRFGFPLGRPKVDLVVKPDFHTDDTSFKEEALREIQTWGTPVAFVDNEPANVNLFHARWPQAQVVFMESDHSPRPDRPAPTLPWIRNFLSRADVVHFPMTE